MRSERLETWHDGLTQVGLKYGRRCCWRWQWSRPPTVCIWLLTTDPISWLPKASEAGTLLGTLLGAQAAIAALTLAVTLFVMQGVSARRDVDDRIYVEYVRRSWVRMVFWGSIIAVAVTGVVLMTESFVGDTGKVAETVPGVPNLALIAVMAFLANLLFALALFERAIRLARPEHWRNLRQDVNKRDVRQAVRFIWDVWYARLQTETPTSLIGQSCSQTPVRGQLTKQFGHCWMMPEGPWPNAASRSSRDR